MGGPAPRKLTSRVDVQTDPEFLTAPLTSLATVSDPIQTSYSVLRCIFSIIFQL